MPLKSIKRPKHSVKWIATAMEKSRPTSSACPASPKIPIATPGGNATPGRGPRVNARKLHATATSAVTAATRAAIRTALKRREMFVVRSLRALPSVAPSRPWDLSPATSTDAAACTKVRSSSSAARNRRAHPSMVQSRPWGLSRATSKDAAACTKVRSSSSVALSLKALPSMAPSRRPDLSRALMALSHTVDLRIPFDLQ